tara:strand:+ start:952 stop:1080 length:129 start_codon:yes stop_codon:yes gene_type:complete
MPSQKRWITGSMVCSRNRRINSTVLQKKPKQKRRRRKGVSTK